jgi:kinetochore protein Spc7/SPC105
VTNPAQSCRELKKYISEGRRIVREIETETFEENPPLFREYMTASHEFKVLMDNQFKNVKTHERLLSKAMWYEWRMKLQEGLREGLLKTVEGMDSDDRLLEKQQELLSSVLPDMVKRLEALELEEENLEAVAHELADCDPGELEDARAELAAVDESIAEKTKKAADLRQELDESVGGIEALTNQKQQYLDEIREADKIREECRGWSSAEISKLKGKQASKAQHRTHQPNTRANTPPQPKQTKSSANTAGPSQAS